MIFQLQGVLMTKEYKQAKEAADKAYIELNEIAADAFHSDIGWDEYKKVVTSYSEPWLKKYVAQLTLVTPNVLELEPKDSIGDYFPINNFIDMCVDGSFINSDGCGTFCSGEMLTQFRASPSLVILAKGILPKCLDGVMWYNK